MDLWSKILSPKQSYAGISAGKHKRYQHPHSETLGHIRGAAKNVGSNADIFATNICSECINKQDLPKRNMGWVIGNRPWLKPAIEEVLRRERPFGYKGKSADQNLAAYMFEFRSDNTTKVIQGFVSTLGDGPALAAYGGPKKQKCPMCAL